MSKERCPHRPPCDGCPRFGQAGLAPDIPDRLELLAAAASSQLLPTRHAQAREYRHRARLAVRGTRDAPKLGLFLVRSHHIVDIPSCVVHHPVINETAAIVKRALRDTGTGPYHDVQHTGMVRYIQVVVERATRRVQLVIVCNAESPREAEPLLSELALRLGDKAHSLWFNGNTQRTNAILGPVWQRLSGPAAVVETLGGVRVFYPPDAFGQANLPLFEAILERIGSWVPDQRRVVEYHAGVGAIGLSLAARVASIDFVEIAPGGIAGLEMGLADLEPAIRARAVLHSGAAGEYCELLERAGAVIVDPPRKGLGPVLVRGLCAAPPERLIYLSCSLESFERDTRALLDSGRFALSVLEPYELFPFTNHVEILALFERR